MRLTTRHLVFFLLAILISPGIVSAITIGSDTGKIFFRNVLRGGYASRVVTLSTDSSDWLIVEPLIIGEASSWISIEPENISLRAGNPASIKVIVTPPIDAANGNYSAMISFSVSSNANPSTRIGSKIITSITMPITIEVVGVEIKSCDASSFIIPDIEINNNPVVRIVILNTGNVRLRPFLNVQIYDRDMENELYSGTLSATKELLPTEEDTFYYEIPISLGVGQYWARLELPECGVSTLTTFDVLETGGLTDKGEFMRIDYKGKPLVGNILEMFAVFRNTGYRSVSASFEGRVELDGEIIRLIDTPSIVIEPGRVGYIPFYFKPEKPGKYIITGRVRYNEKLSYEKSKAIIIKQGEEGPNLLVLLLIIIAAFIVAYILRKKYSPRRIHRF
ncbi:hypothetical protein J7K74_03685 [Candidatus Woesearchaeota archaeon]|nr:hypothetical protein [Candidatus Woesearchaeota archaeon]